MKDGIWLKRFLQSLLLARSQIYGAVKKERPLPEDSTSSLRSPLGPKVAPWLSAEMHFFYFNLNLTGKIENKGFYESLHTEHQNTAYLSCCTHPAQYAHTLQSEQCIAHYMILEVRGGLRVPTSSWWPFGLA